MEQKNVGHGHLISTQGHTVLKSDILDLFKHMRVCFAASVVSDSLQPYGLEPARLLYPWGFSRQGYCSGLPCSPPGDQPRIEPRSSTLRWILYRLSHQGSPEVREGKTNQEPLHGFDHEHLCKYFATY